jgi:hypothetical protein
MHRESMKGVEGGAGGSGAGDIVHNDPDLAAFLKHLVTGEEAAENDDKAMNVWDALDGDDDLVVPVHPEGLGAVLGRSGGDIDKMHEDKGAVSSAHDIFLDDDTEKALVRARGGRRGAGGKAARDEPYPPHARRSAWEGKEKKPSFTVRDC